MRIDNILSYPSKELAVCLCTLRGARGPGASKIRSTSRKNRIDAIFRGLVVEHRGMEVGKRGSEVGNWVAEVGNLGVEVGNLGAEVENRARWRA